MGSIRNLLFMLFTLWMASGCAELKSSTGGGADPWAAPDYKFLGNHEGLCLIEEQTTPYCWGFVESGGMGVIGDSNTPADSIFSSPVQMPSNLNGARQIVRGYRNACALVENTIYCWGYDSCMLGGGASCDGQVVYPAAPVTVGGLLTGRSIKEIAVGSGHDFACALTDGEVYCWGNNSEGQITGSTGLGDDTIHQNTPKKLNLPDGIKRIRAFPGVGCALIESALYCWGTMGGTPAFPTPSAETNYDPVLVEAVVGLDVRDVSAADGDFYVLTSTGEVWSWNGSAMDSVAMPGDKRVTQLTARGSSGTNMCVILEGGTVACWGKNQAEFCGVENDAHTNTTVSLPGNEITITKQGVQQVVVDLASPGSDTMCARVQSGEIYCWGSNSNGWLGVGNADTGYTTAIPEPVSF